MKTNHFALNLFAALLLIAVSPAARSQTPPPVMSHQGRVSVDGVNFDGIGRFKFALVDDTGDVTYWSHDGTSVAGAAPDSDIELPVTKGLYSVLLGDTDIANMTESVSAAVFTNPDVRLRVWFDDGVNGFQQLTPDRRLAAVGYAMMAGNLADGIVASNNLASGSVHSEHLADAAVTADKLAEVYLTAETDPVWTAEKGDYYTAAQVDAGFVAEGQADSIETAMIVDAAVTAEKVDAATFNQTFWRAVGNAGTTAGTHFVGTTDDQPLELQVNGQRVLRLEPHAISPRLVGGHPSNTVSGIGAVVGGGGRADGPNTASGHYATVGGGQNNTASGWYATVGGGHGNIADGSWSFAAGRRARANHNGTFVWADTTLTDFASETSDEFAVRAAGGIRLDAPSLTLVGTPPGTHFVGTTNNQPLELHVNGQRVLRLEPDETSPRLVGGHPANTVSGIGAVVGGGGNAAGPNTALGDYTTVGGGRNNTASNWYATVGGGWDNRADGNRSTVSGGQDNTAGSWYATVGGGRNNHASGDRSTVGGGHVNTADGLGATIPGGHANFATTYAFAAGRRAKANHDGAFVWGDSTNADFVSETSDEAAFRVNGGVRFTSGSGAANQTVSWTPGSASWSFTSDAATKESFSPIDPLDILERVVQLSITEWNYIGHNQRHIGPTAQDFHAAFPLNDDDTTLNSADLHGVALAAIQGLHRRNEELQMENTALKAETERLASELEAIKRHLGL